LLADLCCRTRRLLFLADQDDLPYITVHDLSRYSLSKEHDSYDHARRQQRPISIVILLSTYFSTTTITKKMPPSTKHLLEKFLSLFSCSRLGDNEDDDNEAITRPLVIVRSSYPNAPEGTIH